MTYEDAWANLKFFISEDNTETKEDYIEELELAIEALKKQVPYKPIKNNNKLYSLACPSCNCGFMDDVDYECCPCCGQRLNWDGVDDD